ncbi:MAG: ATP-binding cassette domain-containing protein [Chthonomonadales bacterium]|nr:ATP-binding cassette domain-containing protein [Chthonomonadales bacterium]
MITTNELTKTFTDRKRGSVRAVEGVTLECRQSEVFGILGPNGAGKTTLLRMLATILQPTSGTATVAGYDVRSQGQMVRASIGYLSGSTAPYDRLTPREMLAYFGALHGMDRSAVAERTREVLEQLDMQEFADRRCERLSTGQRQRVNIARAVLHRPPVLFLDEPTAGLDVLASRTVMRFIRQCRDEGRTVVFSTHIMSEVEGLCDRIAVIHRGRLAALGTLSQLRERAGGGSFEQVFLRLIGEDDA